MKINLTIAASALVVSSFCGSVAAEPMPVEYVRVCTAYGAQYYYSPGSETCINADTGQTKRETENGTVVGETALAARVSAIEERIQDAFDAASIAAALTDPSLAAGEHAGVRLNWGNAGDANAFGVSAALLLSENAAQSGLRLTGSAGVAFTSNKVGGRVSLLASW